MLKQKRVVIRVFSRYGDDHWQVAEPASTVEEAQAVFTAAGDWMRGDGHGAIAYWVDVIEHDGNFFLPSGMDYLDPFSKEFAPY